MRDQLLSQSKHQDRVFIVNRAASVTGGDSSALCQLTFPQYAGWQKCVMYFFRIFPRHACPPQA